MRSAGDGQDAVGLGGGAVVLPELHPRLRVVGELRLQAERLAVLVAGHDGAGGEVDADADHFLAPRAGLLQAGGHDGLQAGQVIARVLEEPVPLQPRAALDGQVVADDAVGVAELDLGRLPPALQVHQQRADRLRPEVQAQAVARHGSSSPPCGRRNDLPGRAPPVSSCTSWTARRKNRRPSPSACRPRRVQRGSCSGRQWRSGWGIRPMTRPLGSQMPAMSSTEPFGFQG